MHGRRSLLTVMATAMLALAIALGFIMTPAARQGTTGVNGDDGPLSAVLPEHRETIAQQTDTMPRYTIAATLLLPPEPTATQPVPIASPLASPVASPVAATPKLPETFTEPRIVGTLDLHYVNTTGEALDDLWLRLYPNLRQYGSGEMAVANVQVDGEPVEVQPPPLHSVPDATPIAIEDAGERDLAILRIPLATSLTPGEAVSLRMDFETTVPIDPPDENGLFRYTPETGTWTLAHGIPMLAGHDSEAGWVTDPPAAWSDITFSNTALFDITLTAPADLVLVTTGVEVGSTESDGYRTERIVTGPVRDVAIIADPNLESTSTEVAGTTITSWHRPGEEAGSEQILQWAAQSFAIFTELFGPYPYEALDLVPVPHAIGYEFPQLVFIGSDFYPDPEALGSRPGAIEFLVAHEVAHQWWYGLVGSNPHSNAFLDEGLTEYSTIVYFERQHGEEAAASHLRDGLIHRYGFMLVTTGDQVVDQPTVDFPDAGAYYATVYRKAGLGFQAIREEIGDDAFFTALRSYAEEHRFDVATPTDLLAAFEEASGQQLDDLWTLWFESDRGRIEIVMEPLPGTPPAATPATTAPATPAIPPAATPAQGMPASPAPSPATISATPVSPIGSPAATPVAPPAAAVG
ncbi:MAG TPA: M1 family metallopeptidase [Thermomicrobiales bacterium]|nr:M1 family metallopeptidase [Thermomicrobiales bacterium]